MEGIKHIHVNGCNLCHLFMPTWTSLKDFVRDLTTDEIQNGREDTDCRICKIIMSKCRDIKTYEAK